MSRITLAARTLVLIFVLVVVPGRAPFAELAFGQGLLWRVEAPGVAPSHVFGTFHSSDPKIVALPPPVRMALDESRSLTVEVVFDGAARAVLARAMMLGADRSLSGMLAPELRAAAADVAAAYGLPPVAFDRFKPWALALVFSQPPEEQARQAAGEAVLDERLQQAAQSRGIPVYGLETVTEQVAILDGMSEADQVAYLRAATKSHAELGAALATVRAAYLRQDLAAIDALMRREFAKGDPQFHRTFEERMFTARNRRMVARMAARLEEGGAFIAVGALHLPGEAGVLRLLERDGYRVLRVF